MAVYDRPRATAKRLIAKYGQECQWQKPAPIVEDEPGYPVEGALPASVACHIAWFSPRDIGRGSGEFLALMQGMEVPLGKEIGLLAGDVPFEPEAVDMVDRGNGLIAITSIDRLAPAGVPVLYYVTVTA